MHLFKALLIYCSVQIASAIECHCNANYRQLTGIWSNSGNTLILNTAGLPECSRESYSCKLDKSQCRRGSPCARSLSHLTDSQLDDLTPVCAYYRSPDNAIVHGCMWAAEPLPLSGEACVDLNCGIFDAIGVPCPRPPVTHWRGYKCNHRDFCNQPMTMESPELQCRKVDNRLDERGALLRDLLGDENF